MSQPKPLTPSNILKALGSSSAHWARMIKWVRTQPKTAIVDRWPMRAAIDEAWMAGDCALCNLVHNYHSGIYNCVGCPVTPDCHRHDSLWMAAHHAYSWKTWLTAARAMHRHLRDRYNKLKKEIRSAESKVQ